MKASETVKTIMRGEIKQMRKGVKILIAIVCVLLCTGYLQTRLSLNMYNNNKASIDGETVALKTVEMSEPSVEVGSIDAEVVEVSEDFDTADDISEIGSISYSEAIQVDGMTFNLYPTFDNEQDAINDAETKMPTLLPAMEEEYSLQNFSASSVQSYIDHFYEYLEHEYQRTNGKIDNALSSEMSCFESFIDIYENDGCNKEIAQKIKEMNLSNIEKQVEDVLETNTQGTELKMLSIIDEENNDEEISGEEDIEPDELEQLKEDLEEIASEMEDLYIMMPSNTGAAEAVEAMEEKVIENIDTLKGKLVDDSLISKVNIKEMAYSKNIQFNITKGVNYAAKYAANPNVTNYSTCLKGDCTNFVSQIKYAGGVPKYLKYGESGAWNYQVVSATTYPKLNYSPRWCRADSFVKFFGVKNKWKTGSYSNKRTAFIKFAASTKKGSFIAYDGNNDGSWDHCGFVTAVNSSATIDYLGSKYKDFKVAQHTAMYHRWVSDSGNGWENLYKDHPKFVFAIVN